MQILIYHLGNKYFSLFIIHKPAVLCRLLSPSSHPFFVAERFLPDFSFNYDFLWYSIQLLIIIRWSNDTILAWHAGARIRFPVCVKSFFPIVVSYLLWEHCKSFTISTFTYLWAIYILPRSIHLFCCSRIGGPIVGIYSMNRSPKHECRNWERGRAVSFLGIYASNFRYSSEVSEEQRRCDEWGRPPKYSTVVYYNKKHLNPPPFTAS